MDRPGGALPGAAAERPPAAPEARRLRISTMYDSIMCVCLTYGYLSNKVISNNSNLSDMYK